MYKNLSLLGDLKFTFLQNTNLEAENIQNLFADFTYNHKNSWAISTELDVNFYSAEEFGDQVTVPIWKD